MFYTSTGENFNIQKSTCLPFVGKLRNQTAVYADLYTQTLQICGDNKVNLTLNHFTFKSHCFWYLVSAMACSLSSSFLLVSRIRCSTGLLLVGLAFCNNDKRKELRYFLYTSVYLVHTATLFSRLHI